MDRAELLVILEEILPDMLQPSVDVLMSQVKEYMTEVVNPLKEKVETLDTAPREQPAPETEQQNSIDTDTNNTETDTEEPSTDMPNDPLLARVKLLEQKLAEAEAAKKAQDQAAQDMRFNSTLSAELDKLSPLHKSVVQELLSTRLRKNAEETKAGWLAEGKTLGETVNAFFTTPEGMHFLPSKHVNGANVQEPTPPKTGEPKMSVAEQLMAAF